MESREVDEPVVPATAVRQRVDEASADDRTLIRSLLRLSPEERLAGLRRAADFFANARRV